MCLCVHVYFAKCKDKKDIFIYNVCALLLYAYMYMYMVCEERLANIRDIHVHVYSP